MNIVHPVHFMRWATYTMQYQALTCIQIDHSDTTQLGVTPPSPEAIITQNHVLRRQTSNISQSYSH